MSYFCFYTLRLIILKRHTKKYLEPSPRSSRYKAKSFFLNYLFFKNPARQKDENITTMPFNIWRHR